MLNPNPDTGIDSLFESTHRVDAPVSTTVVPLLVTAPTLPSPSILIMSQVQQAPAPTPTTAPSLFLQDLPNFVQEQVKEQVKEKVKVQVSKILPKIEKTILIEKIESNKSIYRSDEQRNLYKPLVDAYECDKIILDTYGYTVTLKRRRDDSDKDKEPSAGLDQGSKRRREGKEPESTSAPKEKASKTNEPSHQEFKTGAADDQPIAEASQHPEWFYKQTKPPTPYRTWNKTLPATHGSIQPWTSDLAKQADSHTSFNELMDTLVDFLVFLMNRLKVDTLTPKLLAGVESYQKMLNLTRPYTYKTDLKCKEAYTACSNPRGFIYQNKDKQNMLTRIDELKKFSDGTLNNSQTTLDDRLKGIQMKYLPQTI
nr:hypothetical protein [Tanacetum cinerariifolium]